VARVGVVPAAGHAERLQPLRGSKEVLSLGGRPVIDYVFERLRAAEPDRLIVVTRREKVDVVQHARDAGAEVVLARPASIPESLAAALVDVADGDIVMFGFPDSIWQPPDGFVRLVAGVEAGADAALGLFEMGEPGRSDVVTLDERGRISDVTVKPARPASNTIWGCAAARGSALRDLEAELEVGAHFHRLAQKGRVEGVFLSDWYLDIGTPEALAEAVALAQTGRLLGRAPA
jgi:dTDP-glucose pyrophosphorylase